ncbi:hypothetical protein JPFTNV_11880 [Francisella tularensis subsp. holarctica]|uniref:ROK family protein n=1 Tax=Francisella tularensis TaxID=263 RepID=UPI000828E89D|nr:ROK family protein [Francisella tularensis]OCQ66548.1 transcriptional regulator [Francisella tularensis]BCL53303.1 hypothetical protein JPFTNV_11880 [Francisella tularensis subsp. holarctica]BCL54842.1 hypothetical protein JPFTKU_06560 [Francisella tularensis subsp. holarctica]
MYIGLDIGGSNISTGIFDEQKNLIKTAKVKSKGKSDADVILAQIFKVINKLLDSSNKNKIKAIGIGGGLVLNGKLYTGNSGLAAELGHTIIKQGGAYCPGCGSQGCLEAYAGKVGIEKKIENLAKKNIHSTLIDLVMENGGKLKSSHIKKALDDQDEIAMDILSEAMEYLGTGLGSALNMINPSMVILGGGVMEAIGERYLAQIKRAAMKNSFADIYAECDFKLAKLGDQAGIYGAMELWS